MLHYLRNALIIAIVIIFVYAISLFELYTQLARYKNFWDENNKKQASNAELLYVALGDSAAQGIGATRATYGYVGLISNHLSQNQTVRTINLSKSGAKVKDVLDTQLPALQKLETDKKTVITIEIGANDMISFNAEKFEKEMDQLMNQLPPQTLISDMPDFSFSRYRSKEPNAIVANKIMYQLAEKHNFTLVPLHARMAENSGIKTLAVDLFHPTNVAYKENWAKVFIDRL